MHILYGLVMCLVVAPWAEAEPLQAPVLSKVFGTVFVKHDGRYVKVSQGMMLAQGDEVRTLARSKVYIIFPDESRIQLGQLSRFVVRNWSTSEESVFQSSLAILTGAFRYTASAIRGWSARDTQVYTKTAVIGVRGTDFWGRVQDDNTFFLLLEGSVSLMPLAGDMMQYEQAGFAVNIQDTISLPKAVPMKDITPLAGETHIDG